MDAREDLPKISIETERDWRQIQQNLSVALLARLDTELESSGQAGDKDLFLRHVHQFLETVFDIARPNLRVNGRITTTDEPCSDGDDLEQFDEALDRHIWSLSDQRLKWDKEIADRRRLWPENIEKLLVEGVAQHHVCDVEMSERSYADTDAKQIVDCEIQQTLVNALSMTPHLLQSTQSQRGRASRIKLVSAEVKALKS